MATIVKHKESGKHFILVGTGIGAFKTSRPGIFFGDLLPNEKEGELTMIAVALPDGHILWGDSTEFEIVSVDGESPRELLKPFYSS